ncbi:MAG: TonB-dependent receptor plug domain-containing protein, partial [Allosphingosinicella sp.]
MRVRPLSRLALTASFAVLAAPLAAQTAAPGEQDDNLPESTVQPDLTQNQEEEAIVVTGSRIRRPDFQAPNPVVSLDSEVLQASGTTNLTDFLTGYPALIGSSTSADNSGSGAGIGFTGLNLLNLRNLGTDRTLVLVDGRRHVPGVPGSQAIDVNTIPGDLVER